jgi:hypothetical protein
VTAPAFYGWNHVRHAAGRVVEGLPPGADFTAATGIRLRPTGGNCCEHWLRTGRCSVWACCWDQTRVAAHWFDHPRRAVCNGQRLVLVAPYGFGEHDAHELTEWCAPRGLTWIVLGTNYYPGPGTVPVAITANNGRKS